jgi:hypothetical protein
MKWEVFTEITLHTETDNSRISDTGHYEQEIRDLK